MNCEKVYEHVLKFLTDYITTYQFVGFTLGLSGGIDSALALALCYDAVLKLGSWRDRANVHVLLMPFYKDKHFDDALNIANIFQVSKTVIWINEIYDAFYNTGLLWNNTNKENLMARIRMCLLYSHAPEHNAVIVGPTNAVEWETGYFTKYGDGSADIFPIIHMVKGQIYELARFYNEFHKNHHNHPVIPEEIFNKPPSSGLRPGLNDEDDIGPYNTVDAVIKSMYYNIRIDDIPCSEKTRIWELHFNSEHKRLAIRCPDFESYKRYLNPLNILELQK